MLLDIVTVARGEERRAFIIAMCLAFFDQVCARWWLDRCLVVGDGGTQALGLMQVLVGRWLELRCRSSSGPVFHSFVLWSNLMKT